MKGDDIGFPQGCSPSKRDDLLNQIDRDQRDEAVLELFDEARDLYWQAGGSVQSGFFSEEGDDAIRAVMKLCWERWCGENGQ